MKLLFIYHCGFSKQSKVLYREYVRQGIDLTVIVPSKIIVDKTNIPSGSHTYFPGYDEKGFRFSPVDLRKPDSYGEGFKFSQLFKAIKKAKPDIIHVFDEYSCFYLTQVLICRNILYGKKVPVFAYASQNIPFKTPPFVVEFSMRPFRRILRKIIEPFAFAYHKKHLDGVTSCNSEALKIIKDMGVDIPMQTTFLGVDFNNFYHKDRDLCREKIGIPKNIKLVGYIGRLVKEKGLDKLVRAVSKMEDYYLMLPTKGDYEKELNELIDSLGMKNRIYRYHNVKYEELANYYNSLDVFVLPSQTIPNWKEQYGLVLVQAMGCHLPIVGSSSGAIPEVLEHYPKHLIFQEESVDDLRDKIRKVEELKWPENFNIDKFLFNYTIENFVKEYIKFYKQFK